MSSDPYTLLTGYTANVNSGHEHEIVAGTSHHMPLVSSFFASACIVYLANLDSAGPINAYDAGCFPNGFSMQDRPPLQPILALN